MYVIGINENDFIKIHSNPIYKYSEISMCVSMVEYNAILTKATFLPSYESASNMLTFIKDNVDDLKFENKNLLDSIIEKSSFNKYEYITQLKIFRLNPEEIKRQGE